jgi:hypothetical protein
MRASNRVSAAVPAACLAATFVLLAPPAAFAAPPAGPRIAFEEVVRSEGGAGVASTPGPVFGVFSARHGSAFGGAIHLQLLLPHEPIGSGVKVDLRGVTTRLGVAFARRASPRAWLTSELGPGLDIVRYEARAVDDGPLRQSPGGVNPQPFGYVSLGVRVDLGALSIFAQGMLVIQLLRTHYDTAVGDVRSEVVIPSIVQPALAAGLSW